MLHTIAQFLGQPWALPCAIGLAALVLGLLIPKKGGANWLGALLFWPVALLRDLLDAAHTKRLQYYALLLALLGMEAFFSVRAATVYYDVLSPRMSAIEVDLVSIIVGTAVFLCGYMVASHGIKNALGKTDWGNFWIAALVIVHDVAGVVYLNYGPGANGSGDWASISITVGMCAFSLVPFALGNRAEKLRPELEAELEQEVNEFTSAATRTIKRRAVDRVLRLANRTDVIHLVRSLPADEFADFKKFVMPIIAPGTPYNLSEQPSDEMSGMAQTDGQRALRMTSQKLSKSRQNERQKAVKMSGQNLSFDWSSEGSSERQNDGFQEIKTTRKNQSDEGSHDTSKKLSKNALRDARIRQYAATHDATQAQLARHFKVSVSTIARALAESKLPTNGHNPRERDTDKMETLVISEKEIALAHA